MKVVEYSTTIIFLDYTTAYFMPYNYAERLLRSENIVLGIRGSFFKLDSLTAALNAMSGTQKKNEELMETAKKNRRKAYSIRERISCVAGRRK
jgi:hypothetical protein